MQPRPAVKFAQKGNFCKTNITQNKDNKTHKRTNKTKNRVAGERVLQPTPLKEISSSKFAIPNSQPKTWDTNPHINPTLKQR